MHRVQTADERRWAEDPAIQAVSLIVSVRRSGAVVGMLGKRDMASLRYSFEHVEPYFAPYGGLLRAASGLVRFSREYLTAETARLR